MLDDWLNKNQLGVASRTRTMVTFGFAAEQNSTLLHDSGKRLAAHPRTPGVHAAAAHPGYPKFRKRTFK
jgi:hypothetical protein